MKMKTIELFEPTLNFGKYFGLFRPNVDNHGRYLTLKHVLLWIQFILVQIILWFGVIKIIPSFTIEEDMRNRGIPFLSGFVFFAGSAFISTTTYLTVYSQLDKFCSRLDNHRKIFGDHDSYLWIHKSSNARSILWISSVFGITSSLLFQIFFYQQRNEVSHILWPFYYNNVFNIVVSIVFYSVYMVLILIHHLFVGLLFISVSLLFIKEFNMVNNRLGTAISDSPKSTCTQIEEIRQEHASLVGCFESSKSLFKHYLFAVYVVTVPVVGFFLYGLIRGQMRLPEMVTTLIVALISCFLHLAYTLIGAALHARAHEPYEMLNKVDIVEVSETTSESVLLFMKRLAGPPVGYTIYGMMTLDSSAILQLFGTLVTYAIVMLQFAGSSPSVVDRC